MPTRLERLLEAIAPERTWDVVSARADAAVNSFPFVTAVVTEWPQFTECLGRFFRHMENGVLRLPAGLGLDPGMDWSRCRRHLVGRYGPSGDLAAFDMARTGVEGGLRAVFAAVAQKMIETYTLNEIKGRVAEFMGSLDGHGQFAAVGEYIHRYGYLLPSDLIEGSAGRVYANFPKVIEGHPRLLRDLRVTGR